MACRRFQRGAAAAAFVALASCGGGPGPSVPTPTPTAGEDRCRIGGNEDPPGFPAVYETEECVSQGCFAVYAIRAVRFEADGGALESQPGLRFTIEGDPGSGPGCSAVIGEFVLDAVPLSRGGSYLRILKDCVSSEGLKVTIQDQAGGCTAWVVALPRDVRPLPGER